MSINSSEKQSRFALRHTTGSLSRKCEVSQIGNSPLLVLVGNQIVLVRHGHVASCASPVHIPNGNRIVLKLEHLRAFNPTGSLYDRLYSVLLERYEHELHLRPDQPLIEGSVGNAGAAFAWACRDRGYSDYSVIIPEDIHKPRIDLLHQLGSRTILSPPDIGPAGYVDLLERFAFRRCRPNGERLAHRLIPITKIRRVSALPYNQLVLEVIRDLDLLGDSRVDRFVFGVGSGNTISFVGRAIKAARRTTIECTEFAERPFVELLKTGSAPPVGGFWIDKDFIAGTIHGVAYEKLNLDLQVIDTVSLCSRREREDALTALDALAIGAGRTSATAWAAAWKVACRVRNQTIFTIIFDDMSKYDSTVEPAKDIELTSVGLRCICTTDSDRRSFLAG